MIRRIRRLILTFRLVINNEPLLKYPLPVMYTFIQKSVGQPCLGEMYRTMAFHFIVARILQDIHPWARGGISQGYADLTHRPPFVKVGDTLHPIGSHIEQPDLLIDVCRKKRLLLQTIPRAIVSTE